MFKLEREYEIKIEMKLQAQETTDKPVNFVTLKV